jgi:hypothetical protein
VRGALAPWPRSIGIAATGFNVLHEQIVDTVGGYTVRSWTMQIDARPVKPYDAAEAAPSPKT